MCMMIYIAADQPLPLVSWDERAPGFNVRELSQAHQSVRKQFSKPHIYEVGSHRHCGCGFSYGNPDYAVEGDDDPAAVESVRQLSEYLTEAVAAVGTVELFAAWYDYQEMEPECRSVLHPKEIGGGSFWFDELEFIEVRADAS